MRPINVLLFGSQLGVATDWLSPLSYLYPKQKSFTKIAVFKIEREDEIRSGWKRTSLIIRHYGYCLEHQQSNIARTSSSWPIYEPRRQVHGRCGDSNIKSRFGLLLHQHVRGNSPQASKTEYSTSRFHQVKNIASRKTTNETPPFPYFSSPATVAEPQNCWNLAFSMVGWAPKSIHCELKSGREARWRKAKSSTKRKYYKGATYEFMPYLVATFQEDDQLHIGYWLGIVIQDRSWLEHVVACAAYTRN